MIYFLLVPFYDYFRSFFHTGFLKYRLVWKQISIVVVFLYKVYTFLSSLFKDTRKERKNLFDDRLKFVDSLLFSCYHFPDYHP